ncbi:hypothetical protein CGC58_05345 [Capnocytophaga stomatis]|uniref:Uncharacterized protein n=1 Tax=Capnocytophaga stomatis TaxID=1848904 RepID=A0A250FZ13_9FLAO|nr:hypothetical protein [Capnocytophaga stomatis]ATA89197.1 hypothetical protein CGC58_05345 [Capnocytophaga stomatis]
MTKKEIIQLIHTDWKQTPEEERYFTEENIQKCSDDLDIFCKKMENYRQTNASQEEYAKAIYEICENLATFNREDEEPEYLHGFLYNVYTEELTNFIRETAFANGFQLPAPEIIPTEIFSLQHSTNLFYEYFSVYIGKDNQNGVCLLYNIKNQCFEYDENPYGDSYLLPVFNFQANENFSEISFEVLSQGRYKHIKLVSQHPEDKIWLKNLAFLHQNEVFNQNPPPDFCDIEIQTWQGNICRIDTTNRDSDGNVISMFTEGSGILLFIAEVDKNGNLQIENDYDEVKSINDKLFLVYAVPDWCGFEVDSIAFKGDLFTVTTKNNCYKYNEDRKLEVENSDTKVFTYEIKTFPFMLNFLKEITASNKSSNPKNQQ